MERRESTASRPERTARDERGAHRSIHVMCILTLTHRAQSNLRTRGLARGPPGIAVATCSLRHTVVSTRVASHSHTHTHTHTHTHPTHSALHLGQVGEHIECLRKLGPTHRRCTHDCLGRSCVRPAIQTPLANTWRPRWRNAPLLKLPGPPQRELSVAERAALDILERHGRLRDPDRAVVDNFVPHLRPYLSLLSR